MDAGAHTNVAAAAQNDNGEALYRASYGEADIGNDNEGDTRNEGAHAYEHHDASENDEDEAIDESDLVCCCNMDTTAAPGFRV